jgi:hypothetical protein
VRAIAVLILVLGSTAAANPCTARLAAEARRADAWTLEWRLLYTSAAIGETALAITPPLDLDTRRIATVGAIQATVAAGGIWLLPLRIDVPERCEDVARAEQRAVRDENRTFWLLQAGNLAINAAGAIAVGELTTWPRAGLSFAVGFTVGLAQIYTLPKDATKWTIVPIDRGVAITGVF